MAGVDDHRWPVCAANMATGAARSFARAHHLTHFVWVVSVALYVSLGCMMAPPIAALITWGVICALYWAAALGWADQELSGF